MSTKFGQEWISTNCLLLGSTKFAGHIPGACNNVSAGYKDTSIRGVSFPGVLKSISQI